MQNLLADLCVEAEASTLMAMKMSSLFNHANMLDKDGYISKTVIEDENMTSEQASSLFRIGVAVTKYYVTKRLPQFVYECMEVPSFLTINSRNRAYRHTVVMDLLRICRWLSSSATPH